MKNYVTTCTQMTIACYTACRHSIITLLLQLFNMLFFFFFFSSRRRHTRWTGDWSSDVCSSDLCPMFTETPQAIEAEAKSPTPSRNIRRRPKASPKAPPDKINAERNNPYDSTTHCTSTTVACRLD